MAKKKTEKKWLAADLRAMIEDFILTAKELLLYIFGGRGVGKTYTSQKVIIQYCIDNQKEFGLLVPTVDEKKTNVLKGWLDKVFWYEFPEYLTRSTSDYFYIRKSEEEDWVKLAYCIPLAKAGSFKKRSMPKVDFLVWDESVEIPFNMSMERILEDVLTAYHTIDRDENRVKLVILSNFEAGDKRNVELFDFFNVDIKAQREENSIVVSENKKAWHIPMASDIVEDTNNAFRRMIKGTKYGDKANGIFRVTYGNLLLEPNKTDQFIWCFALWLGETPISLMLRQDGIVFTQIIDESFVKEYCSRIYTVLDKDIHDDVKFIPPELIEYLQGKIKDGRFKFCDEDSYYKLVGKMSVAGMKILT